MAQLGNGMDDEELRQQAFDNYFVELRAWYDRQRQIFMAQIPAFFTPMPIFFEPIPAANLGQPECFKCKLPSVWKRLCAEFIDTFIMLLIKLHIIIGLIHSMDVSDLEYIQFAENPLKFLQFSKELAIMEIFSRLIIYAYETYFLSTSGATPGKYFMGLQVFHVNNTMPTITPEYILAWPLEKCSTGRALVRTILKNMGILIFPFCYGFMTLGYLRTGYDYVTSTIVVDITESLPTPAYFSEGTVEDDDDIEE